MSTAVDVENGACAEPLPSDQSHLQTNLDIQRSRCEFLDFTSPPPANQRSPSIAGPPQKSKDGK